MEIKHEFTENKGSFYIELDGARVAEMFYSKAGAQRMIISHTEVSDVLRGKSAGKQMVTASVEYARQNNLKILPLCPFARSVFEKVPAFADVWDH